MLPADAAGLGSSPAAPEAERPGADVEPPAAASGARPTPPSSAAAPEPSDAALRAAFEHAKPVGTLRGRATYYHDGLAGNRTASGERYDPRAFTAAHRSLPFGTVLRVRRAGRAENVYVRVTDRGPFGNRRLVLDLSRAAAERIGLIRPGVADVVIEIMRRGAGPAKRHRAPRTGSPPRP